MISKQNKRFLPQNELKTSEKIILPEMHAMAFLSSDFFKKIRIFFRPFQTAKNQ